MTNWLDNLTGKAGTVLDTVQDVIDVVHQMDGPAVTVPTTVPVAPAPAPAAPAGGSSDNMLLVLVVVVLAIVLLR